MKPCDGEPTRTTCGGSGWQWSCSSASSMVAGSGFLALYLATCGGTWRAWSLGAVLCFNYRRTREESAISMFTTTTFHGTWWLLDELTEETYTSGRVAQRGVTQYKAMYYFMAHGATEVSHGATEVAECGWKHCRGSKRITLAYSIHGWATS